MIKFVSYIRWTTFNELNSKTTSKTIEIQIQTNSKYQHSMFFGDKVTPKSRFLTTFGLTVTLTFDLLTSKSQQLSSSLSQSAQML